MRVTARSGSVRQSGVTRGSQLFSRYLTLCKPRVVLLMILTAIVGMCMASKGAIPWEVVIFGNLGIALVAGAAAAVNHLVDEHIDRVMKRTQRRPVATGEITTKEALIFAVTLCVVGMLLLLVFVNILTAVLTFLSLLGYAGLYTLYLKHKTSQNIVIGGIAGAAPPLLGWVAVTGHIDPGALLLLLIIFVWTPPHFWALAIYRKDEYAKANVPMLPVTHGVPYTKVNILIYSILLVAVTLMPYAVGISGGLYLGGVSLLNAKLLQMAYQLYRSDEPRVAFGLFKYSIVYLMLLFVVLLLDHYLLF